MGDARTKRIVFIDVEASGLCEKSWPIEIGWGFVDESPHAVLIKPDGEWPHSAWDKEAEALHGLTIPQLERDGADPRDVCHLLNASLSGAMVYSDALDWDGFWLYRLYTAGGVKPEFDLSDFADLMRQFALDCEDDVRARADVEAPRLHRAAADVAHMQAVYRFSKEAAAID